MTTDPAFPQNIVDTLATSFATVTGVDHIEKRELEPGHANGSVGIFAVNWVPLDWEIGAAETRGKYYVYFQTINKDIERDKGAAESSKLVKSLRLMVYRSKPLQVALAGLSETILGATERALRWGVQEQRYQSNVIRGEFIFVSATQFWLETEILL